MNLNQLRYFRVIVDEKQYTKAASKLFISQPSLSNSMKAFEEDLGGKLFNKRGHQIELTKYGQLIYKTVCNTLDTLDQGIAEANKMLAKPANTLRVACLPTTFGTTLPKTVRDFKKNINETAHFILFSKASISILEGIQDGRYDIGISSYKSGYEGLHFTPFYTEDIIILLQKEHPLAHLEQVKLSQLNNQKIITYTNDIPLGETIANNVVKCIKPAAVDTRSIDEVGIAGLVASGQGIGVCANTSFLQPFDLVKVPLDIPSRTRVIYTVYNKRTSHSELVTKFLAFLAKDSVRKTYQLID